MIAEIVVFDLPEGTDLAAALTLYRQSAGKWLTNPELIEKYYIFDQQRCSGGGVYIWPSRDAAARWHGEEYRRTVRALYGSEPRIQILDAVIHVDPVAGKLTEVG
jgi:hypothetical protein